MLLAHIRQCHHDLKLHYVVFLLICAIMLGLCVEERRHIVEYICTIWQVYLFRCILH